LLLFLEGAVLQKVLLLQLCLLLLMLLLVQLPQCNALYTRLWELLPLLLLHKVLHVWCERWRRCDEWL